MTHIKDVLKDLVGYAVPLSFNIVRVTGTDTTTMFEGIDEDRRVVMKATVSSGAISEFKGRFGMPNLKVLKGYVDVFSNLENVDEKTGSDLKIAIQNNFKADPLVPTDIQFSVPTSTAVYRLQREAPNQVNMKEGIAWDAEVIQPPRTKITEFSSFASILSDAGEKNFTVKTVGSMLKFYIGDESGSTSKVNFVFADGIKTKVDPQLYWRCSDFLTIMNLAANANTTVRFSNLGVIQITVDTGIITYDFKLPGART